MITSQHECLCVMNEPYAAMVPLPNMSCLDTTAKYATFTATYASATRSMANGAARLIVRTGSRTSDKA
jgi:hypothetical protein